MNTVFAEAWPTLLSWLLDHGVRVAVVLLLVPVALRVLRPVVDRVVRRLVVRDADDSVDAERQREDTLIRIICTTLTLVIWILAGLMVLQELGFQTGPLLAMAGVAGVALGLGGQSLIRDVISGLFIILENQFRIGDAVRVQGTVSASGVVENISLRMTTLRDMDGAVHHVPNGEIKSIANLSKGFARVNLDVGVGYTANLDKVIATVNRVGEELAADPAFRDSIIKPPQFLRVQDFADSAVIIKIVGDTQPLKQWEVTGELRRRLKVAFDAAGIDIPFPQQVVHSAQG